MSTVHMIEPNSPTWRVLKGEIRRRIADYQQALEANLDSTDTALLRGRIAELRSLIEAVEPERPDEHTEIGSPLY